MVSRTSLERDHYHWAVVQGTCNAAAAAAAAAAADPNSSSQAAEQRCLRRAVESNTAVVDTAMLAVTDRVPAAAGYADGGKAQWRRQRVRESFCGDDGMRVQLAN
eukprot:2428947-Pleurochrysis_carterae.AAC.1